MLKIAARPIPALALLPAALLLATGIAPAQEPLVTDRPDFTESPVTVDPGRFQLEAGYTFTDSGRVESHTLGEALVRIGLGERTELRLGLPSYESIDTGRRDLSGFGDPFVGVKLRLTPERAAERAPVAAILVSTTLPAGSSELREPHPQPGAIFAVGWSLTDLYSLGANVGLAYASDGGDQFTEITGSLAAGRSLGPEGDTGVFLEYFFVAPGEGRENAHFVDTGVTRLFGPDFQLDLRIGIGLNSAADDLFAGAGFAWRK